MVHLGILIEALGAIAILNGVKNILRHRVGICPISVDMSHLTNCRNSGGTTDIDKFVLLLAIELLLRHFVMVIFVRVPQVQTQYERKHNEEDSAPKYQYEAHKLHNP